MSAWLPSFLSPDFLFRNALLGGALVAGLCGLLGIYVVLRRLELLAVALPQASAAGIALAFWLSGHGHGADPHGHGLALLGALGGTFGCLLALAAVRRSQLPTESRLAALYALASAGTVLFVASNPVGDVELTSLLRGDLLAIADHDLVRLAVAALGILILFAAFRREILLASVDPDLARTLGRDPTRADALLYALLGVAISLGVMCAGPLVVFGFLTLPALAALRAAGSLAAAFALAVAIGVGASGAGFALAYRLDLPAGPLEVALAAVPWLAIVIGSALRRARGVGTLLALAVLVAAGPPGCAHTGPADAPPDPAARGSFPPLAPGSEVAVLPVRNDTGEPLRLAAASPLHDLRRAAGDPFVPPGPTVAALLTETSAVELARRGIPVRDAATVQRAFPSAPSSAELAAATARSAGLPGPLLVATLRRYRFGESRVLDVRLDFALVDVAEGRVLWRGEARRPIPLAAAQTQTEVALDATRPIFDQALGTR